MPDLTPDQIKRALEGDAALMRCLVDTLTPVLQKCAARALARRSGAAGNRDVRQEVEDLVQTVFTTLCTSDKATLLRWDPERGALTTYVRRVAEREIASILRSMRQNPWTEDPTPDESLDLRAAPRARSGARRGDARAPLGCAGAIASANNRSGAGDVRIAGDRGPLR